LSAGGKDLLGELIAELARLQALMNKLKSARREMDAESFRKQQDSGRIHAAMLNTRFPFLGTILGTENPGEIEDDGKGRIMEAQPLVIPVDLFG